MTEAEQALARLDAFALECRLRADPDVTRRREEYHRRVGLAKAATEEMTRDKVITALVARTPAYSRSLLETEDERFGQGALAERYARTFWKEYQ